MTSLRGAGTQTPPKSPLSRRTSSNMGAGYAPLASPMRSMTPAIEEPPPRPAPTQAEVAKEVFEKELRLQEESEVDTDMIVVLHDACYGHRFSRPKTSRASLLTIVERPERVIAIIEGLSMAYVRLGGRHIGGAFPLHPKSPIAAPPFRIKKSTRSLPLEHPAVTQVHGAEWMKELKTMAEGAGARLALDGKELTRPSPSSSEPKASAKPRLHEGDLYLCSESLNAFQGALGGVCDAVDAVFHPSGPRRAFACVRPPGHHCSDDYPSGFCWLNNVHVGIAYAMQTHGLTHAAIIDFDLHHGDGSQTITWAHNSKVNAMHKNTPLAKRNLIGYFSLHDINSYPCEWGDIDKVQNASLCIENAHGQTVWNVHLQEWKTESDFWQLYETRYLVLIDKMRQFLRNHAEKLQTARRASQGRVNGRVQEIPAPKAAIFVSAGFDASEYEGTGMQRHKVNVPTDFYARFTRDIAALSEEEGLGVDGRVISVLEGGYSDRALASGVFSHVCGMTENAEITPVSADDLAGQMSGLSMDVSRKARSEAVAPVDESWWSTPQLDEFDAAKHRVHLPPPAVPGPKKGRGFNPTFITPTQASQAKALPPRRSLPGKQATQLKQAPPVVAAPPRPPTPPPPPVEWSVAALELSKILVPSDRQTLSCKPEELAAPRQRKARQSDIGVLSVQTAAAHETAGPLAESKRSGLRERKAKPVYASDQEEEKPKKSRPPSRTTRRRTIGGAKSTTPVDDVPERPPVPEFPANIKAVESHQEVPAGSQMYGVVGHIAPGPNPMQRALSDDRVYQQRFVKPPEIIGLNQNGVEKANRADVHDGHTNTIDALAGSIKKMSIKLHVPTREEHDAREREKKAKASEQEQEQIRHSLS